SPFNFTSIAGNLPTSAALMGNTVLWKPASTAAYSAHFLMKLFEAAGLPPGVINLVYGSGSEIGDPALASPDLAGVHFTGSTPVFQGMWKTIGANIATYRNYPRIVGETGGKDFIVAHPYDDAEGYFVEPTVLETTDPNFRTMKEELFGPVVTTYVYPEAKYGEMLELVDKGAPYGLTGAVFARERDALELADEKLRYAAGN